MFLSTFLWREFFLLTFETKPEYYPSRVRDFPPAKLHSSDEDKPWEGTWGLKKLENVPQEGLARNRTRRTWGKLGTTGTWGRQENLGTDEEPPPRVARRGIHTRLS